MIVIGRHLMTADIFDLLWDLSAKAVGEIQLNYAMIIKAE
jgi:UTP-glucose-1-phosphate uridylyltransferase